MKLVIAVINRDDSNAVMQELSQNGFSSTRLATTGGFLMAGNVTLLIGVEKEKVAAVLDIIRDRSHSRKEIIPSTVDTGRGYCSGMPMEVTVGGATIFVVDVEQFERF